MIEHNWIESYTNRSGRIDHECTECRMYRIHYRTQKKTTYYTQRLTGEIIKESLSCAEFIIKKLLE